MLLNHPRALAVMDSLQLDALVAAVPRNVYYASGFWTRISEWGFQEPQAVAIIPRDPSQDAILILPEFALAGVLESPTWIPRLRITEFLNTSPVAREPEPVRLDPLQADIEALYASRVDKHLYPNIVAATADALRDLKLAHSQVGFDDLRLAHHVKTQLDALQVQDAHDAWLEIRKVKTPQEVDFIKRGAAINEAGLRHIMPMIRPGVLWRSIAGEFRRVVQEAGANLLSAQKALQFGTEYGGEYFPDLMLANNDWRVKSGQTIIFESWGTYSNYAFDVSRTVHVGEPSREYADLCAIVSAAQQEAAQLLRAGMTTHQAWRAISNIAYAMPIPTPKKTVVFFHSIGLDIIELPSSYPAFGQLKDFSLEKDMVVNFEYLYFGHSVAPFHLESSYLIAQDHAQCLHTLPHELLIAN